MSEQILITSDPENSDINKFPNGSQPTNDSFLNKVINFIDLDEKETPKINSFQEICVNFKNQYAKYLKKVVSFEQKCHEIRTEAEELEDLRNSYLGETIKHIQKMKTSYENRINTIQEELNSKNLSIETLKITNKDLSDSISQLETKISKLELSNSNMSEQLKHQAEAITLNLNGLEKTIGTKKIEFANIKGDMIKITDRISSLEGMLAKMKEMRIRDQEIITTLTESFENLKAQNFKLNLDKQCLAHKIMDLQKNQIKGEVIELKKSNSISLLDDLHDHQKYFKKFSAEVKISNESMKWLEDMNDKLSEEKQKLILENTNLKISLAKISNENQIKESRIQESFEHHLIREIDDKFYHDTLETLQKYERELERKETENSYLLEEKSNKRNLNKEFIIKSLDDLRKRVKELEDYIRSISDKIKDENDKLVKEPDRYEKVKELPKRNFERLETSQEKKNNEFKNELMSLAETRAPVLKKSLTLQLPESLGIKKTIKNLVNIGPSSLSGVSICAICSMIIGKKEHKFCKNCPGQF